MENEQEVIRSVTENEELLRTIFNTAEDGIITIDKHGVIQQVNPALCELFGYSEDELIGTHLGLLMPDNEKEIYKEDLARYLEFGIRESNVNSQYLMGQRKDRSIFPFRLGLSEFTSIGSKMFTGIIHDITDEAQAREDLSKLNTSLEEMVSERTLELKQMLTKLAANNEDLKVEMAKRKKVEEQLSQALEKEKELGMLKTQFLTMASHEFRTPLNGIMTSATLIEKYPATNQDPQRRKHVDRIKWSVNHLTTILEEFLSAEHLRSGKVVANPSHFKIEDLVAEIKDKFADLIVEGKYLTPSHTGDDIELYQDEDILKSVIMNLLSNAFKYAGDDLDIEVNTEIVDNLLKIEVTDDGIGIPEEDQKHLFERFFRARNTDGTGGTGLGLDIVMHYVKILKGEISFESTEGVGTTFRVVIPANVEEAEGT